MADYDLIVIGAGPGGYVAAIRASQLGLKSAVIEKEAPGGVCLNWGCIPSKALIHQAELFHQIATLRHMGVGVDTTAFDYAKVHAKSRDAAGALAGGVSGLLKKHKVDYLSGEATFENAHTLTVGDRSVSGDNIIVATGSRPREIAGFEFDGKKVMSSRDLLGITKLPKKLLILGAGAIGMEFAYVMNAFGVDVTVVEMLDTVLPLEDKDSVDVIAKAFKKNGVTMLTGTKALRLDRGGRGVKLEVEEPNAKTATLSADMLLVAVGRAPNTAGLHLEEIGVRTDRGFIEVGDHYQTAVSGVYAIGDVIASPQLAHVAMKEGEIAVEHIAGHTVEARLDPAQIPQAVYCEPQVASFGLTEAKARASGTNIAVASFPYRGAGKSVAIEKSGGHVKLVYNAATHEIVGAHAVGSNATELIHELLLAKKAELLPEDIATMVHAHPTLSEAVMEGARAAEGWAIHG